MSVTVKVESVETKKIRKGRTDEAVTYKVTMVGANKTKVVITTLDTPFVDPSDIGKELTL